jgi:hypothetical protein
MFRLDAIRQIGVVEQTYYLWLAIFADMVIIGLLPCSEKLVGPVSDGRIKRLWQ